MRRRRRRRRRRRTTTKIYCQYNRLSISIGRRRMDIWMRFIEEIWMRFIEEIWMSFIRRRMMEIWTCLFFCQKHVTRPLFFTRAPGAKRSCCAHSRRHRRGVEGGVPAR
jgi:hypothetical protein